MHDTIMFNVHSKIYGKTKFKSAMQLDLKKESSAKVIDKGPGLSFQLQLKHGASTPAYSPSGADYGNMMKSVK